MLCKRKLGSDENFHLLTDINLNYEFIKSLNSIKCKFMN